MNMPLEGPNIEQRRKAGASLPCAFVCTPCCHSSSMVVFYDPAGSESAMRMTPMMTTPAVAPRNA
jgi:hypothetical protein